jgi:plastocyanin
MIRTAPARIAVLAIAATILMACPGDKGASAGSESAGGASAAATANESPAGTAAAGGEQTPDEGHKIIVVKMITDGTSNRFEPANFEVDDGDVIRFTLESGVHNVHFLPDSNPGKTGLPAAPSDFLQLPGQTYDVKVTWEDGTYYYQCDPHAVLGMKGHITVK